MKEFSSQTIPSTSVASTVNGTSTDSRTYVACSAQAVLTGSPVGTLKLQWSNDLVNYPAQQPTNWTDLSGASVAISAAGVYGIPLQNICYQNIRAVYVATSGTGTVVCQMKFLGF